MDTLGKEIVPWTWMYWTQMQQMIESYNLQISYLGFLLHFQPWLEGSEALASLVSRTYHPSSFPSHCSLSYYLIFLLDTLYFLTVAIPEASKTETFTTGRVHTRDSENSLLSVLEDFSQSLETWFHSWFWFCLIIF